MNELLGLIDLVFGIGHDQTVQVFILVAGVSSVGFAFTLLDGAFAADGDLGAGFLLHGLEGVATWSN